MAETLMRGRQVRDGAIQRDDLDASTAGQAVIRKVIAGTNISLTYTGTDSGTGDVTISASGGSGLPAGADTNIQFNDGGVFGGGADLAWDKTTNTLKLGGADTGVEMTGITNEPAIPAAEKLRMYVKNVAGRLLLKWVGPSGVDMSVQESLGENLVSLISPGSGTAMSVLGCAVTNVGTVSHPAPATTNLLTQTRRSVNTSTTTAGALASTRCTVFECWRGNATGRGGFRIIGRFGLTTLAAGMRAYIGVTDTATTAATNIDPTTSTTPGKIGMAINTNSGNWNLVHNASGTAPTVIALGANFPVNTTDLLELQLTAAPNASSVGYRVMNLSTGNSTSGTITTNLPSATTWLGRVIWATNNATAAAVAWTLSRFYLGTDY